MYIGNLIFHTHKLTTVILNIPSVMKKKHLQKQRLEYVLNAAKSYDNKLIFFKKQFLIIYPYMILIIQNTPDE